MPKVFDYLIPAEYSDLEFYHQHLRTFVVIYTMNDCAWCRRVMPAVLEAIATGTKRMPILHIIYDEDKSILYKEPLLTGFPTIVKYVEGTKPIVFEGPRTKAALQSFFT